MSQNGKGDKPRPYKIKKYGKNYDDIDWSKVEKPPEKEEIQGRTEEQDDQDIN